MSDTDGKNSNILATLLGAGAFWAALSGVAGAGIGYFSSAYKDNNQLVIELMKKDNSVEEKMRIIDELIDRGLLQGVNGNKINNLIRQKSQDNPSLVPSGLACQGIWCSLSGKTSNIKQVYTALGLYSGAIDSEPGVEFSNATISYQKAKNLEVDGIVGAKTFALIMQDGAKLGIGF
jgi:peptidoglycan hydrolase-like protein with peptidoglycan-binding domain